MSTAARYNPWERGQIGIKLGTKQFIRQKLSKATSLACKCVVYRSERNAKGDHITFNFENIEM